MGLHYKGFLISLLILLPNILLLRFAPRSIPKLTSTSILFTVFERIGQITCFVLPILYGRKIAEQPIDYITLLMGICLIIYYLCWIRFFGGGREFSLLFKPLGPIPIPMALFPMLYFILLAYWLHSYLFVVPALIFSIGHFVNSWSVYTQIRR
ncbi:hypothetical protein H70357_30075 [Paenibacillus sp. FSL H7-0357]|nr:hypothetical protein H70357_30075 [Paenibacillus sp. FSL H7-0357]